MAAKKTGISLDLIIHPGETIADVLEERGLTQVELAARTGINVFQVVVRVRNIWQLRRGATFTPVINS